MGTLVNTIVLAFLIIPGGEAGRQTFEELESSNHLKQKRNEFMNIYADRNRQIQRPPPECLKQLLRRIGPGHFLPFATIRQVSNSYTGRVDLDNCNDGSYSLLIHVMGIRQGMVFSVLTGNGPRYYRLQEDDDTCGHLIINSDQLPPEQSNSCSNTLHVWNSTSSVIVNMVYMFPKYQ